ncbi:2-hydroxyacid dehydrogenase [Chelativorans oligotrophicus]|uniref:D-isomer specific 2-hydroxyacid dehydrogenase, NAD-binding protein n=1 Tax=Chelativorans sp. (strain BNC1) TaxID=266779 RepID=Q11AX9_CHESB|nr:glyoxylate/hydroxypyruvate reductase A [Chelativorans oligotrophicus]
MPEKPASSRILLSVTGMYPRRWHDALSKARTVVLEPDGEADPTIEYAVVWKQKRGVLNGLPNLKLIFSAGAGVDHLLADPELPAGVPIVRVVAENLTQHMVEYVCWRVLDHHRQGMTYRVQQVQKVWHEPLQPPANEVAVGIMGLGELGSAAARALLSLGFKVNGWSRREKRVEGVSTFYGEAALTPFLNATDILVVLLPLTGATEGIIDFSVLDRLRKDGPLGGPCLINAGRGQLQKEADILRALDQGVLKEASLDVFEQEPLDPKSPLWTHPKVFVTPHAAATSDPAHLVPLMLEQMDAFERGEPLKNLVDREAGY